MDSGKARLPVLGRVYGRTPGLRAGAPYTREDVRVPMRDGARLAADDYAPSGEALGTLLVRGPYGRGVMLAMTAPERTR